MDTRSQFDQLLRTHEKDTGFQPPELLHNYLVELLDSRLTLVDIIPDPSFAERWLTLHTRPTVQGFKDFGDTCLFFTSLLPEWGQRRGLSMTYYAELGRSSYVTAADLAEEPGYQQLAEWFYTLQRFLNSAIKPEVRLELFNFRF